MTVIGLASPASADVAPQKKWLQVRSPHRIGTAHQGHLARLQREFMPLATLAAVDHQSPYYHERDKSSIFYAESWALLHFLRIGADGKYAARLVPFLEGDSRRFAVRTGVRGAPRHDASGARR